jgi:putative ABC transport system permease protein
MSIINSLSVSLLETLPLVPASIGFYISLRVLRFPDLTVEGSFILGSAITAYGIEQECAPLLFIIISILFGGLAGLLTAFWNIVLKVPEFTSGIITTFILTWMSFGILKELSENNSQINEYLVSNRGLFESLKKIDDSGVFYWGEEHFAILLGVLFVVIGTISITAFFLQTKTGLLMRAYGSEKKAAQIYNTKNHVPDT